MAKTSLQKILVALDGSKNSFRALRDAISLARQIEIPAITGIFVIQSFPTEMGLKETSIGKTQEKHCRQVMQKAKYMCMKKDVNFFGIVEYGNEGKNIVSFAKKNSFDLIVIGTRGMGKLKEFFLGSVSNYVVHLSKLPVLVIK